MCGPLGHGAGSEETRVRAVRPRVRAHVRRVFTRVCACAAPAAPPLSLCTAALAAANYDRRALPRAASSRGSRESLLKAASGDRCHAPNAVMRVRVPLYLFDTSTPRPARRHHLSGTT